MRKIVAAMQMSVDGFIEGPNAEVDWIDTWEDPFDLLSQIDTVILGGGMYPGYEHYWRAIFANPESVSPFTGKVASKGEVAYARFADKTAHVVVSTTLENVAWNNTRIVRNIGEIRQMKELPGQAMHAVGGATLVSSLVSAGLVDELRLVVRPIVLGGGKALFKDVKERHALRLLETKPLKSDLIRLTYATQP
jgi:dihydrofolate reductase